MTNTPRNFYFLSRHVTVYSIFILVSITWTTSAYWGLWIEWWYGLKTIALISGLSLLASFFIQKKEIVRPVHIPLKQWIAVLTFSLLTSLLCIDLHINQPQILATCAGCIAVCFLAHAIFGRFSIIFWILFLFLELAQLASYYRLSVRITSSIIAEILHASHEEISSFATPENLAGLALALLIAVAASWQQYKTLAKLPRRHIAYYGCLTLAVFYLLLAFIPHGQRLSITFLDKNIPLPYPIQETINILKASSEEARQDAKLLMQIQNLPSPAEATSYSHITPENAGIVCILHIGESVRADRLGFNGYHRNTTPWLSTQKNLISYPQCISLYHQTTTCIVSILTDGARNEAQTESFSLISPSTGNVADLFSKHGFYTALFTGYNAIYQKNAAFRYTFGEAMLTLHRKANCIQESESTPMRQAEQVLNWCHQHPENNLFIILNNEGSHGPFHVYDLDKPTFTPADTSSFYTNPKSNSVAICNAYDNTIVYTDSCIRTIAEGLKGRPFLYVYVSDHGEYLGEDELWGRSWVFAHPDPKDGIKAYRKTEAARVGMFYLPSDEWLALHPHFKKAASQLRANRQFTICHGHIYDTLLGLFGIESPHYNSNWDCSSSMLKPYNGTQPQ